MKLIETGYKVIYATTNEGHVVGHFDLDLNSGTVNCPVDIRFNSFKNWLLSLSVTFKEPVEIHINTRGIIVDIIDAFGRVY